MFHIFKIVVLPFLRVWHNLSDFITQKINPVSLPYDNTNPVIYDKDDTINCYTDEYLMALASAGEINLIGMITSSSIAPYNQWVKPEDFDRMVSQRTELVTLARKSGFQSIPNPLQGTKGHLEKPISCKIEDTIPIRSRGSELIVNEAKMNCSSKPIVAVMCGPLTVIADAYLIDKSISNKVIVAWFGGRVDDMADYNGLSDAWAAYIVLKNMQMVQFPAIGKGKFKFPYSPIVPKTKLYNLPKTPLRKWMIEKEHPNGQPGIWDADAPPAISLMRSDYMIKAKKVSFSHWLTDFDRKIPAYKNDPKGKTLVITKASQKVATKEWWRALKNPKVYSGGM